MITINANDMQFDDSEYLHQLDDCIANGDAEVAHLKADDILCELLTKLGFEEVVNKFNLVRKWYV